MTLLHAVPADTDPDTIIDLVSDCGVFAPFMNGEYLAVIPRQARPAAPLQPWQLDLEEAAALLEGYTDHYGS